MLNQKIFNQKYQLIWAMTFNFYRASAHWRDRAMWHDHDIDFARWLYPAMWHVALESWQWIHQVAALCNVIRGSGITCHGIRPNVRHIGILHLISILTISAQSTCHSAPVCEILSKSNHPQQKKKQVALLSQRGRAMLRVFNIPTAQYFINSYCGFRFTSAKNSIKFCFAVSYCPLQCPTKTPGQTPPRS